jgi:hypothetical protein
MKTYSTREEWLVAAGQALDKKFFAGSGYDLPNYRTSCGWAKGSASAIGQCFNKTQSADETFEIFVCPTQADPLVVVATLLHELIHAAVGTEEGHKGKFRTLAKEFGFAGKMTATFAEAGTELHTTLVTLHGRLGDYPHAVMTKKKKATKPTRWVRFKSTINDDFKVVANIDKVDEHGAPHDPWGEEMVPN